MEEKSDQSLNIINRCFSFLYTLRASDRFFFRVVLFAFIVSVLWLILHINTSLLVEVPERGGTLTEGIVGTPRFVNPILAVTNADHDLSSLIYAGIMKLGKEGVLITDMAESLTISEDGLTYNIILRDDIYFHDGEKVQSDDIIFTINRLQDPAVKSPLRASWEGVTTEGINERELNILLPEPYAPFVENLTLGILPLHIWEFASAEEFPFSQHNSEPIGSGPYKVSNIKRSASGIPESYILVPHKDGHNEPPRISSFKLNFYSSEEKLVAAYNAGAIQTVAGLSKDALNTLKKTNPDLLTYETPLPRTFVLFFNQNEAPLFRERAVRRALNSVIDKEELVREVLGGYGTILNSPIPPGFGVEAGTSSEKENSNSLEEARSILRTAGWKLNEETEIWEKKDKENVIELSFSIATVNNPVFSKTAELIRARWQELGARVDLKQFEQSDLTQSVIRPRKYDTLLFGTVVGRELDFYSFWHSSQRNDPGLNVALYANITTDSILTEARTTNVFEERLKAYKRFSEEIASEVPAIFLYVPSLVYVMPSNIENVSLQGVSSQSERFSTIREWFIETESVWPVFAEGKTAL